MNDIEEYRVFVSELIRKVLIGELSVRNAITLFPSGTKDKSIEAAFHALIHYEADEDIRRRDILYREEQDDYLTLVFQTLEQGKELPDNIIKNYEKYYKEANIPHAQNAAGTIKGFLRYLNIE